MQNTKYLINIYYQEQYRSGSSGSSVNGEWVTSPSFSGGWYVATMPEAKLFATSSTQVGALNALLAIATASTTPDTGYPPINSTRF